MFKGNFHFFNGNLAKKKYISVTVSQRNLGTEFYDTFYLVRI